MFCKSLVNFELDNLKYKKKKLIFRYGFEYKFKKLEKKSKLILKSIPKNLNFCLYFKLSNSKFVKDLQNTQTQTQNPNTQKLKNRT